MRLNCYQHLRPLRLPNVDTNHSIAIHGTSVIRCTNHDWEGFLSNTVFELKVR